jgi:uncharacterized membrane protein YkoI
MKTGSLFLAWVVGTTSLTALADDDARELEQIRRWVEQGRILSLQQILDRYPTVMTGRLLDLEVEREGGRILYEMEFLQPDGRVIEFKVDAARGVLLRREVED